MLGDLITKALRSQAAKAIEWVLRRKLSKKDAQPIVDEIMAKIDMYLL